MARVAGIPGYDVEDWGSMGEQTARSMMLSHRSAAEEWVAPMSGREEEEGDERYEEGSEQYEEGGYSSTDYPYDDADGTEQEDDEPAADAAPLPALQQPSYRSEYSQRSTADSDRYERMLYEELNRREEAEAAAEKAREDAAAAMKARREEGEAAASAAKAARRNSCPAAPPGGSPPAPRAGDEQKREELLAEIARLKEEVAALSQLDVLIVWNGEDSGPRVRAVAPASLRASSRLALERVWDVQTSAARLCTEACPTAVATLFRVAVQRSAAEVERGEPDQDRTLRESSSPAGC